MPTTTYELEITLTTDFDGAGAAATLGERVYPTGRGAVRVRIDWARLTREPFTRVSLELEDERADGDARDLPAFVELFFHDAFLMLNLAAPGSFGGVITAVDGEYGVREVALDPWLFQAANAATLPLANVVAWYDSLGIGTRQIAPNGAAKALFHLLYLARAEEEDLMSVVRLSLASEAVGAERDAHLIELRDAMLAGDEPVVHPMYDDALDPDVDDAGLDVAHAIDRAAAAVIATLQRQIRAH